MERRNNKNNPLLLGLVFAGSLVAGVSNVSAQDVFYIEHKPTQLRFSSCSSVDGTAVTGNAGDNSECAQWNQVANGDFFYLQNASSGKYIRPASSDNGAAIEVRPNTWRGNWTQWSYDDRGDGFGHLVNRATGKYVFIPAGGADGPLQQQPSAWRGDYTRWRFVTANTPTPAPAAEDVSISNNSEFGDFLVGGPNSSQRGFTLYTFANDNGGPNSNCNGQCAVVWPPLLVDIDLVIGDSSLDLGTTVRDDGSIQVTYQNEPLYFYQDDTAIGDTNGHNVGGVWFVAQVNASTPSPSPDPQTPTPDPQTPSPTPGGPTPNPACTPGPSATIDYEAEAGTLLGSASVYDDGAASGGQGVAFISTQNAGFRISTSQTDASSFVIRYASELSGSISYRINQVDSGNVSFNSTGAWVGSYNELTVNADVPAGAPIDVFFDAGDTAMNVDYIRITDSGCSVIDPPTPTPASTATPAGPTPTPVGPTPAPTPNGPTPTPNPNRTPLIPPDGNSGSDFCLTTGGEVTHTDKPFRANFHFLCLNGSCQTATLVDGVWRHGFGDLDPNATYTIMTQLDDDPEQCNISADVRPGECVASPCLPPDDQAPTAPTNLQAEGRNGQAVRLSWNASTDDRAVTRYEIFRNGVGVDFVSATTYNDSGLNESTDYTYEVRACDAASNCSAFTAPQTANTGVFVPDETPPTVPSGLSGEALSISEISVTWNESTDAAGVVAKYDLRRDGSVIASINDLSYVDTGLSTATSYAYSVRACDDSNNCSAYSSVTNVETNPPDFGNLDWTSNSLLSNKPAGPPPRANPPRALPSPINGAAPTSHGFAFDITDSSVTWRSGGSLITTGEVEYYCSEDGGMSYTGVSVNGSASNPCSGVYDYFFRYAHPTSLNNNPAHRWLYTAPFTTAGSRVSPSGYASFTDGSANWMRFRHPISQDGTTAAVLDAQHNADRLRNLDRYTIWVDDRPGNVQLQLGLAGSVLRNESLRSNGGPNGQQFFAVTQSPGFGGIYSYGQVIQFEVTAVAGATGAQTYNDFSYYTVGLGWGNYGDLRLNSAGRAGTTMILSDAGAYIDLERNAVFTQPLTTLTTEKAMDDFILGHHLFHGIDPNDQGSSEFDVVKIGERSCGDCHFRDGRGSEIIQTPRGPRLPPPTYGTGLLLAIEGREVGLAWDGRDNTMEERVRNAFAEDHGVNADHLPGRVFELVTFYTEVLTVPDRLPQFTDDPDVNAGSDLFLQIGCADCHTPVQTTSSNDPAFDNLTIRPYTDMKLWNLGEGDFRTAPLWGLGQNIKLLGHNGRQVLYMHDGGSTSVSGAISRHGGSAASSRSAYNGLSGAQQNQVDAFVNSL